LRGEVLFELGISERDAGDAKAAEATMLEATKAGAEAKDDTLIARAMIEQLSIIGFREGRHAEALALVPFIEAAIARAGGDPLLLDSMYTYQSILLRSTGKLDAALPVAKRAVELAERADPGGRELAKALIELGNVHADRTEREVIFAEICSRTGAQPVQHIGKVLVLFRENPEPLPSSREESLRKKRSGP